MNEENVNRRIDDITDRLDRYDDRLTVVEKSSNDLAVALTDVRVRLGHVESLTTATYAKLESRDVQRAVETKERRQELKSARRWIIGSVITASGVVVGAVAVFLQAFGGAP